MQTLSYESYLRTPLWRAHRNRALALAGYKCRRCPSKRELQVHHVSYERLGEELDSDLEVLCRGCHLGHHYNEMQNGIGIYIKVVSDVLSSETFECLSDLTEAVKCRCARLKLPYHNGQVYGAIAVLDKRIKFRVPAKYSELAQVAEPGQPFSRAEASGILQRLGLSNMVKVIQPVKQITQRQWDKRRVAQMISAEIVSSIERCEALEAAASDAELKPTDGL